MLVIRMPYCALELQELLQRTLPDFVKARRSVVSNRSFLLKVSQLLSCCRCMSKIGWVFIFSGKIDSTVLYL